MSEYYSEVHTPYQPPPNRIIYDPKLKSTTLYMWWDLVRRNNSNGK